MNHPSEEQYAPNLGITYRFYPYEGTLGARLTTFPDPNSAAASIGLEPGDMIVSLDEQTISKTADVLRHVDQTSVTLINIRTGRLERDTMIIPRVPPPRPRLLQPQLARIVRDELRAGSLPHRAPKGLKVGGSIVLDLGWIGMPEEPFDPYEVAAIQAQARVELIRKDPARASSPQFWDPVLREVEGIVDEILRLQANKRVSDFDAISSCRQRIDAIYRRAAESAGWTLALADGTVRPAQLGFASPQSAVMRPAGFSVNLIAPANSQGLLLYMTRFKYRLASHDGKIAPRPDLWESTPFRGQLQLNGVYAVKVRSRDGSESGVTYLTVRGRMNLPLSDLR